MTRNGMRVTTNLNPHDSGYGNVMKNIKNVTGTIILIHVFLLSLEIKITSSVQDRLQSYLLR